MLNLLACVSWPVHPYSELMWPRCMILNMRRPLKNISRGKGFVMICKNYYEDQSWLIEKKFQEIPIPVHARWFMDIAWAVSWCYFDFKQDKDFSPRTKSQTYILLYRLFSNQLAQTLCSIGHVNFWHQHALLQWLGDFFVSVFWLPKISKVFYLTIIKPHPACNVVMPTYSLLLDMHHLQF